jgi:hypothetical protein
MAARYDLVLRGGRVLDPAHDVELAERLRPELCLRAGVVHRADASLLAESTADVG